MGKHVVAGCYLPTTDFRARSPERGLGLTASQGEVDRNLGLHLDRFAVQVVGLVTPLLYGIDRRRGQHRVTADQAEVLNRSILADDGL